MTMTPPTTTAVTPLRPSAHFTSHTSWLNDPNGLVYHQGVYHLFFQTNPFGSTWGNISWGHATSTDLVSWTEQAVAIPATDEEMAFSGSAVVDTRNTAGFANDGETALVAIYTSARPPVGEKPGLQAQSLAFSTDDGATWTRYAGNPVLDIGSSEFRDPKVFWHGGDDGNWVMVVVDAVARKVLFYTSNNLIDWTFASDFGPAHATSGVWECPDLFPLRVEETGETRWVLIVSMNPGARAGGSGTQYFVGDFDGTTFVAERLTASDDLEEYDWLDHGRDYYAAVSFDNAPDNRRLMIGWASNWDYANETPTSPWRSAMSLVREMRLVRCADGRHRLGQVPVIGEGHAGMTISEHTIAVEPGSRSTIVLDSDGATDEQVLVHFDRDGDSASLTVERGSSGIVDFHPRFAAPNRVPIGAHIASPIDVRIVVDATVIEIFLADGTQTVTEQVFPSVALSRARTQQ
ncbi:glycosyl hydrolase family 32 [Pseudoclavibacter sp. RFBJ3]|uniref:glycoside hydrolase family 32 protein n=1 Tax=unclassified Pseudoclavibacter TaxID=2615177 RepID=UPI000CE7F2AC|nr:MULTISPECIES: glycoside hydrolase family 32 protein [unclassified Pseudoclavibacter]PPF83705.1 glycosyl hydrolase family 32 [Pseudoclavibacter sp. RFBJ5]PPF91985.1 glycosyl hydrolase family 32 [Pseudoclavibacter sp. RFBJ3]PPF96848.1 glycosyl hydrolase family 32 [Pseudoclavibacter sp. RFBH5]PPG23534.1 glycosyl hydrolase family 32 [Pseudoclavibacter sp. RFBI4]